VFGIQEVKHDLCLRHFGFINKGHLHSLASSTGLISSAVMPQRG
jgi:hypothetical protein